MCAEILNKEIMSEINITLPVNNQSTNLICPIFTNETKYIDEQLSFWVGGVMVCFVTCTGFLLNLITIYVLYNDSTQKNVFNLGLSECKIFL